MSDIELDTSLTPELIEEGMLRELIRLIQELRQEAGYQMKQTIKIGYQTEGKLSNLLSLFSEQLKKEVNASEVIPNLLVKIDFEKEIETDWGKILITFQKSE